MISVELGVNSWRRGSFEEEHNTYNLRADLDLIHEIREEARIREEVTKGKEI